MKTKTLRDLSAERIETKRLILIPVSADYADQMLIELTADITKYMAMYPPKSLNEELKFIKDARKKMVKGTDLVLMILDKITHEYLGGVGLHQIDTASPSLGIWIKKSAHGNKIGREAVEGVKLWAEENLIFDYLVYPVHKNNIPSRKIAEALKGKVVFAGIKRFPSGKVLDEVIYHIF